MDTFNWKTLWLEVQKSNCNPIPVPVPIPSVTQTRTLTTVTDPNPSRNHNPDNMDCTVCMQKEEILNSLMCRSSRCLIKCGVWDAGKVWKSKVQGIHCGAKVRGNV